VIYLHFRYLMEFDQEHESCDIILVQLICNWHFIIIFTSF